MHDLQGVCVPREGIRTLCGQSPTMSGPALLKAFFFDGVARDPPILNNETAHRISRHQILPEQQQSPFKLPNIKTVPFALVEFA